MNFTKTMEDLKNIIETAWADRSLLKDVGIQFAIREVIEHIDKGRLRTAEPSTEVWQVNEWVKKAVVMYFPIQGMKTIEVGPFEFHDKMKLKNTESSSISDNVIGSMD